MFVGQSGSFALCAFVTALTGTVVAIHIVRVGMIPLSAIRSAIVRSAEESRQVADLAAATPLCRGILAFVPPNFYKRRLHWPTAMVPLTSAKSQWSSEIKLFKE
jgi:hypothetical protein